MGKARSRPWRLGRALLSILLSVLLLASGVSGIRMTDAGVGKKFSVALNAVCQSLAEQIVSDGEGVQHVIRLHVTGARSREEAMTVARKPPHCAAATVGPRESAASREDRQQG